jgi:hypothetical protein
LAFAAKAAHDAVLAAGQHPVSKMRRRDAQKAAVEASASTGDKPEVKAVAPVTSELIERPHSMITGIVVELQNATPDKDGGISLEGIRIHEGSRTRIIALLHNLAHALELRSITIGHGKAGLKAEMLPDVIRFEILEGRKLERHEPTPSELRKEMDFQRRRDLATRRGQWLPPEHFYSEYDYHYSAKLSFEVHNWADGARKKWSDGKRQTLEAVLESIADGILYHLHFDKARREKREEDERRWQHMARRRELQKQRNDREQRRIRFLNELATYQQEAANLRAIIASASTVSESAEPEYRRMVSWAKDRLAYLDAQNAVGPLTANLKLQNLFPESDELFDPEGDPN